MSKQTDVVVIGGGVIGTSTAYYVAKKGGKVTLIEREEIAGGTSGACDGFIIMQSKNPGQHLELAMQSAALYKDLANELEFNIEYRTSGGMIVIENELQAELMREVVAKQVQAGLQVELLTIEEAREMEPMLSPGLWGATYCAADAQVNPIRVAQGFAKAAGRFGACIKTGVTVTGLIVRGGKVQGVETTHGPISCDYVVNAAGAWAPELLRPLGIDIPITPRRGQILVTEPLPPVINHVLLCACYLIAKYRPQELDRAQRHQKLGVGLAVEQTENGGLLLGSTREFAGYDRSTTLAGIEAVAKHVRHIFPQLAAVNIIRSFAGLRPYTPDGLPILGPLAELPGMIMAAGHEGDGIALAPVTGRIIADYLE